MHLRLEDAGLKGRGALLSVVVQPCRHSWMFIVGVLDLTTRKQEVKGPRQARTCPVS